MFLYTKGKTEDKNEALAQLLRYIERTVPENAVNPVLQDMQTMVETVKRDREVSVKYMKIFEREQMLREEGIEEGIREERANTERERQRADKAEQEVLRLKKELEELRAGRS